MGGCVPGKIRNWILRLFGHRVTGMNPACKFGLGNGHLYMGSDSYCNFGCFFDLGDDIFIGKNVAIGMNVHFITTTNEMGSASRRAARPVFKSINIGDGCWIGADSIILPGVTIGRGTVVGAGSLVLMDLEDNSLYVGRPAKKIKNL